MIDPIVQTSRNVTLIGAGPPRESALQAALTLAPEVGCADGGADVALAHGLMPRAVIGDFDSVSIEARTAIPVERQFPISEQESTDFDKCLRNIVAPLVLGVGFDGTRMDHQLAAFNTLLTHAHRRCILVGAEQIVFVSPPRIGLDLPEQSLLSLFPLGAVQGRSEGLRRPIEGLRFAPDGRVGTSNQVVGSVQLSFDAPAMLIILPRAALAAAAEGLIAAPGSWPARMR